MNKKVRKTISKLHLWLGLPSGIVVFIVCVTGCLYVFKQEITDITEPWRFTPAQQKTVLLPSELLAISDSCIDENRQATAITYGESTDAVWVDYYDREKGMSTVFVNQYDGQVNKTVSKSPDQFDFFGFVLKGHRTLWLPGEIGKPIVGYSVLLFTITIITGLFLWWPRKWTRANIRRNFTIRARRLNFDFHNVLGGYSALLLLVLCLTGLIWSLDWFGNSVYYITSGGKEVKPYVLPKSDTTKVSAEIDVLDKLYLQLREQEPEATTFYFALPQNTDDVIRVSIVHERGSFYKTDNLFFDRYTLEPLQGQGPYAGKYTEVSTADKIRRINLEIHDGRILGVWGKMLAFVVSLIGASLPVTGIIIWWRRKQKKN